MKNTSKNNKKNKLLILIHTIIMHFYSRYGIGRFYLVKLIKNMIFSILRSNYVEINGHKMFLDSKDCLGLSIFKIHEPAETELIKKEVKKGDIVIDIGAHIGYFTLLFAKLVGKNGKVFAFEPDPTNFAILKKNIELNGYKNVTLVQKAVSDKIGKTNLHLSEDNDGDHTIYDKKDNRPSIVVSVTRLDDYFKNKKDKINFIKVDTEGVELKVIKGMPDLLKKNKNIKILTEFWANGIKKAGIEPKEILNVLIKKNFKIYQVNEQNIKQVNIPKLLKTYTPKKRNYTTLLCLKK